MGTDPETIETAIADLEAQRQNWDLKGRLDEKPAIRSHIDNELARLREDLARVQPFSGDIGEYRDFRKSFEITVIRPNGTLGVFKTRDKALIRQLRALSPQMVFGANIYIAPAASGARDIWVEPPFAGLEPVHGMSRFASDA